MCGIVGILQYESEVPRDVREKVLRILFSDVLIRTEDRGEDATGIYQVHENGDWMMTKKGVKSSDWVYTSPNSEDEIVYSELMDSWNEHASEISALVGHCRKATIGSRGKDNYDNHPFAIQLDKEHALLGIHNGTLDNHEVIYKKLPEGLTRHGKTDSEIIFHFLYHMTEQGTKPITGEIIQEVGRRLDGAFACIAVNSRFPNLVSTFREVRPMEYFMISPINIVLVVSEKRFATAALKSYRFYRTFVDSSLPELEYDDKTLSDRDWRIFDTSLPFPQGKPTFSDWNKISTTGEIRKFADQVPADWLKTVTTKTTPSTVNPYSSGSTPSATANKPTAVAGGTNTVRASKTEDKKTTTSKPNNDVIEVEAEIVELDLSEVVSKKTIERVRSLGICTHYDTISEVNLSLGGPARQSVHNMSPLEIANAVGKLHFALGYAASTFDKKNEREELLRKSRDLLPKLESAQDKKKKAEDHIWEHKQLLLFMVALSKEGYSLDVKNVAISLSAFPTLSTARKMGIMDAAKKVFADEGSQKMIQRLRAEYKKAGGQYGQNTESSKVEATVETSS